MDWREWTDADAARVIRVPELDTDKYSRGVLGVLTGSTTFPGAAVLGVEAAARTGVGMIRYLGDDRPAQLVLQRRPEAVTAAGRVQAWLIGSGMDDDALHERSEVLDEALASGLPVVLDAGALGAARRAEHPEKLIVTPHARELVRLLTAVGVDASPDEVREDAATWARRACDELGATVLLKGATTHVADPMNRAYTVSGATSWLATAGTGDVLGGVIGALAATSSGAALADVAATGALLHASAALTASRGGPIAALDVAESLPAAVASRIGPRPAAS